MSNESLTLRMNLGGHSSTYILGPLAGLELGRFVPAPPPVYIIDRVVARLHPEWIEQIQENCLHCHQRTLLLDGGESIKTLSKLDEIFHWLADLALPRDGTIVAIGGGTVLDLVGMAASTWRRGLNFISIPTTLLAMVDAAIGGKTAINTAGLKNPVGTFHPASGILADVGFLSTLRCQDWRDGMAELIKTAAIGEAQLFDELYSRREDLHNTLGKTKPHAPIGGVLGALPWLDWVSRAAAVKVDIVNKDFREQGLRKALNLGHTLGHVLEADSQGTDNVLSHGQAVAIGMAVVFRISAERGLCPLPQALQMLELLEACGLPTTHGAPTRERLDKLLGGDKKSSSLGGLSWVLPHKVGQMDVDARLSSQELLRWLDEPSP